MGQTSFGGSDTTLVVAAFYGPPVPALTGDTTNTYNDASYRSTYELRYTGDSTIAPEIREYWWGPLPPYPVPFEVWNTSTGRRVSLAVYDFGGDGQWDPYDLLCIVNYAYDSAQDLTTLAFPFDYGWLFGFDEIVYNPSTDDIYTIEGAPLNGPDDVFTFKVDGIDTSAAKNALGDIRVVPDPYFVKYSSMVETSPGESVLEFQNIPNGCTIRIYTLAGDLVRTIEHTDGTGTERWDLLSGDAQQVASGIYLYHVESPYGEHLGRFAIIK
jgi:hypothetical protein